MTEQQPNIHQRLHAVMKDVGALQKKGKAPDKAGGFAYDQYADVVGAVRPLLIKHGIALIPNVAEHTSQFVEDGQGRQVMLSTVRLAISFVNVDAPDDRVTVEHWGYGLSRSDKGPGIATTYAMKTAILKVFFIESRDDIEAHDLTLDAHSAIREVESSPVIKTEKQRFINAFKSWSKIKKADEALTECRNLYVYLMKKTQNRDAEMAAAKDDPDHGSYTWCLGTIEAWVINGTPWTEVKAQIKAEAEKEPE